MSDDDWGTLSIDRGKALGSEIATLRHRYIEHRNALAQLIATAPNEALEKRYHALHEEIVETIANLGELEQGAASTPITSMSQKRATSPGTERVPVPFVDPPPVRPTTPPPAFAATPLRSPLSSPGRARPEVTEVNVTTRVLLIALLGVAVLTVLALMLWKPWRPAVEEPITQTVASPETAAAEVPAQPDTVATTPSTTSTPKPVSPPRVVPPARATPPPARSATSLEIRPPAWDYGRVRKGTRATHKFQILNRSKSAVAVTIERSRCRCLWFDAPTQIPPLGVATLVVSVDGARATRGPLNETIRVVSRTDPSISAVAEITAAIE